MAGTEVGPGTGALGGDEGGEGGEATLGARLSPAPFPSGANGGHFLTRCDTNGAISVVCGELKVDKGVGVLKGCRAPAEAAFD